MSYARTSACFIAVVLAFPFLTGCSTTAAGKIGMLDNRVSCTLDGKHMLFSSMYGPVGVTAKVEDADGIGVCKSSSSLGQIKEVK